MKNYYLILGIRPDATAAEVRAAYRRLVKQYHPDHYGEDSGPFLELQQAYAVLSDPAARRDYDRTLRRPPTDAGRRVYRPVEPQRAEDPWEPFSAETFWDSSMSFEELFRRLWREFERGEPEEEEGPVYRVEVEISPAMASRGGQVEMVLPIEMDCPACQGFGIRGYRECRRCHGEGSVSLREAVVIAYPAGIRDGDAARFELDLRQGGVVRLEVRFRIVRSKRGME